MKVKSRFDDRKVKLRKLSTEMAANVAAKTSQNTPEAAIIKASVVSGTLRSLCDRQAKHGRGPLQIRMLHRPAP
jgi:hypothetical protein